MRMPTAVMAIVAMSISLTYASPFVRSSDETTAPIQTSTSAPETSLRPNFNLALRQDPYPNQTSGSQIPTSDEAFTGFFAVFITLGLFWLLIVLTVLLVQYIKNKGSASRKKGTTIMNVLTKKLGIDRPLKTFSKGREKINVIPKTEEAV